MGNPPKRVVYQKLIRRYFKKRANIFSEEAQKLKNELIKCWEQYGVDHPKCVHLVPKMDKGWAIDLITKQKYQQQVAQYPSHFENLLAPTLDHMYFKGQHSKGSWIQNRPFKMPKY
jgi:hypothetical protein